jgi:hypothetical protein
MKEYRILHRLLNGSGDWTESLAQEVNTLSREGKGEQVNNERLGHRHL